MSKRIQMKSKFGESETKVKVEVRKLVMEL